MTSASKIAAGSKLVTNQSASWQPFTEVNRVDPYPMYSRLRELDPVHQTNAGNWVITGYAEVCAVFTDKRFEVLNMPDYFRLKTLNNNGVTHSFESIYNATHRWLFYTTRPTHTYLRELIMQVWPTLDFTGCVSGVLADTKRTLEATPQPDLNLHLAKRVPALIMTRLLGFPENQATNLQYWGEQLASIFEPMLTRPQLLEINASAQQIMALIEQTVADHKAHPRPTLIGRLVQQAQQSQITVDHLELLSLINNLFVAGGETTRNLIGNGCYLLAQYPEQRDQLRRDPGLLKTAVDEILRFESPVQLTARVATENVVLAGRQIRAGQELYLCQGAANRDEKQFDQADIFDISRQKNKHLAFGYGTHFCLGSQLARMQDRKSVV